MSGLKGTYYAHKNVYACTLGFYWNMITCFNGQKNIYFPLTVCGGTSVFTLCLF